MKTTTSTVSGVSGVSARFAPVRPQVTADVFATKRPGVFHVLILESAMGEVLRQGAYRLHARTANAAGAAALWLFGNPDKLPCMGFTTWR